MATPTYTLIDSVTLGSSASSVTFSGISASGKGDLVLVVDKPSGDYRTSLKINGQSYEYTGVSLQGNGSGIDAYNDSSQEYIWSPLYNSGGNAASVTIWQIMDFASTSKRKTVLSRNNIPSARVSNEVWLWRNTSAITSLDTGGYYADSMPAGTTVHLYQIISEAV
jgi:hypothetical protein